MSDDLIGVRVLGEMVRYEELNVYLHFSPQNYYRKMIQVPFTLTLNTVYFPFNLCPVMLCWLNLNAATQNQLLKTAGGMNVSLMQSICSEGGSEARSHTDTGSCPCHRAVGGTRMLLQMPTQANSRCQRQSDCRAGVGSSDPGVPVSWGFYIIPDELLSA